MRRIAVLLGLGLLLVGSSYAQQNEPRFTGKSVVMDGKGSERRAAQLRGRALGRSGTVTTTASCCWSRTAACARRRRAARSRSSGKARATTPARTSSTGTAPRPVQALVQVNVGFGGATKWIERVTDAEYNGDRPLARPMRAGSHSERVAELALQGGPARGRPWGRHQ